MLQIRIANLNAFLESVRVANSQVSDLTEPFISITKDWLRTNQAYFQQTPGMYADLSNGPEEHKIHIRGYGIKKTGEKDGQVGGYKKAKLKRWGFVYPILKASGKLERSLTTQNEDTLFEILNKSFLMLGTRVHGKNGANYPKFLNDGTKYMPARPFIQIPQLSVARWKGIIRDYVIRSMGPPGQPAAAQKGKASGTL